MKEGVPENNKKSILGKIRDNTKLGKAFIGFTAATVFGGLTAEAQSKNASDEFKKDSIRKELEKSFQTANPDFQKDFESFKKGTEASFDSTTDANKTNFEAFYKANKPGVEEEKQQQKPYLKEGPPAHPVLKEVTPKELEVLLKGDYRQPVGEFPLESFLKEYKDCKLKITEEVVGETQIAADLIANQNLAEAGVTRSKNLEVFTLVRETGEYAYEIIVVAEKK